MPQIAYEEGCITNMYNKELHLMIIYAIKIDVQLWLFIHSFSECLNEATAVGNIRFHHVALAPLIP